MNDEQLQTLEQVKSFMEGSQSVERFVASIINNADCIKEIIPEMSCWVIVLEGIIYAVRIPVQ